MSVYTENFEGYAEDTLLTAAPNWLVLAGSTYKVKTSPATGSKAAYINAPGGVWAAAIYNGASFDATVGFGWRARLGNARANMVWGIQATTLDGATSVGCYILQALPDLSGGITLFKTWTGGVGAVTILSNTTLPPGMSLTDFEVFVVQQAGRIRVFVNGATTPTIDYTDPSPLLTGKIGIQTFQSEAYWDDWDGRPDPVVPGVAGSWAVDFFRHRGRR